MTSRGHVIVLARSGTVIKYTADAEIIRELRLSSDMVPAYYAIETWTGTSILISGMCKTTAKGIHRGVYEVSYEGHIIRSFTPLRDLDIGSLLISSFSMTTDADNNVYVLELNRVITLDSSLNLGRVIQITDTSLNMIYSQETKQLIVGCRCRYHDISHFYITIMTIQLTRKL